MNWVFFRVLTNLSPGTVSNSILVSTHIQQFIHFFFGVVILVQRFTDSSRLYDKHTLPVSAALPNIHRNKLIHKSERSVLYGKQPQQIKLLCPCDSSGVTMCNVLVCCRNKLSSLYKKTFPNSKSRYICVLDVFFNPL